MGGRTWPFRFAGLLGLALLVASCSPATVRWTDFEAREKLNETIQQVNKLEQRVNVLEEERDADRTH